MKRLPLLLLLVLFTGCEIAFNGGNATPTETTDEWMEAGWTDQHEGYTVSEPEVTDDNALSREELDAILARDKEATGPTGDSETLKMDLTLRVEEPHLRNQIAAVVPDVPPATSEAGVSEPTPLESGPDPLAAAPTKKKAKAGGDQPRYFLFCYGGNWCDACRYDKPRIAAFANSRGLTISEANIPNARNATIRLIDITRDRVLRDLQYDKPNVALYPTYVLVDWDGEEVWHHVGALGPHMDELETIWDILN